ncbi:MAG TPA: hypothetical protein DEB07_02425 [Candidatus Moranbacteria bacterium]|nr:hypothetical protein [Candidatus Moranbacteria bacterium]
MKRSASVFALLAVLLLVVDAQAAPKWVDAVPSCTDRNVTIPSMPVGTELLNVQVYYRDAKGSRNIDLGPSHSFKLDPSNLNEGFNFTYRDAEGVWWQMITSQTPTVNGVGPDCSDPRGCIYICK